MGRKLQRHTIRCNSGQIPREWPEVHRTRSQWDPRASAPSRRNRGTRFFYANSPRLTMGLEQLFGGMLTASTPLLVNEWRPAEMKMRERQIFPAQSGWGTPPLCGFQRVGSRDLNRDVYPSHHSPVDSCSNGPMPRRSHRHYGGGHVHFITTSCYHQRPFLGSAPGGICFSKSWNRCASATVLSWSDTW